MVSEFQLSTPDGSNQAVHPDVIDTVTGFQGWRYWMACTPYPFGNDRLENPVIRVSQDGVRWEPVEGAPDPLFGPPVEPDRHWSDTDLTLSDGRLHLVFRGCARGNPEAQFLLVTSADGRRWSDPRTVWTGSDGVSPALHADEAGWTMWHIQCRPRDTTVPTRLVVHRGRTPGEWDSQESVPLDIPGHNPWHIDVQGVADGYEAIVAAYPHGADPSRCSLFHLRSDDGVTFVLSQPKPVLRPSWRRWDNRMVYRSSFVKQADGTYRIWHSGASWGMRCGIGLAEGHLPALDRTATPASSVGARVRLREDVVGLTSYIAQHRLPAPMRKVLKMLLRR